ncbi:MAG: PH domain-containing protein [Patescibacteria group bacterium]|jgi:membrane protein YdbS with pleckstrin-like domain
MNEEFKFDGQKPGEKILAVVKNHPFVLFGPGIKLVVVLAMAVALVWFWSNEYSGLIAFVLSIVGIGIFSRSYYLFSRSNLIVTNMRIVNIDQGGYLRKKITETELSNIQDISSSTSGLLRTVFKYGDLVVRTAGATAGSEIIIRNVANPYAVQQLIVGTK